MEEVAAAAVVVVMLEAAAAVVVMLEAVMWVAVEQEEGRLVAGTASARAVAHTLAEALPASLRVR